MKMSIGPLHVLLFPLLGAGNLRRHEGPDIPTYMHHRLVSLLAVMGLVNLSVAAAVVVTLYGRTESWMLLGWATPIFLFSMFQILWSRRHKGLNTRRKVRGRFLRKAEIATGLIGAWWGLCIMLPPAGDAGLKIFMFAIVFGMCAGVVAVVSPVVNVSARFLLGAASIATAGFVLAPEGMPITVIGLGFVLVQAASFAALNGYRNLVLEMDAKRLAAMNHEQLLDAVAAIPEAFAIYDAHGQVIIENAVHRRWFPKGLEQRDFRPGTEIRQLADATGVMRSCVPTSSGGRVVIHTDVSKMELLRQEADDARRDAEEARLAVERFVGSMTRELRLPLHTLRTIASRFETSSQIPFEREEVGLASDAMVSYADQALTLVDEVLSVTEAADSLVDVTSVSLKTTVDTVIEANRSALGALEVGLSARAGDDLVIGNAKSARIVSRVLSAVLMELGRSCRGGGEICVRFGQRGEQGWVAIEASRPGGFTIAASETAVTRPVWHALMQTIGGQIELRNTRSGSQVYMLQFRANPARNGKEADAPQGRARRSGRAA
jgi:signal transduction histidine kinase